MAMQAITVALAAVETATFTFTKPLANYGKTLGLTITDGAGGSSPWFIADVDNGNGTMTGTIKLSAPVTGVAEVQVWDKL